MDASKRSTPKKPCRDSAGCRLQRAATSRGAERRGGCAASPIESGSGLRVGCRLIQICWSTNERAAGLTGREGRGRNTACAWRFAQIDRYFPALAVVARRRADSLPESLRCAKLTRAEHEKEKRKNKERGKKKKKKKEKKKGEKKRAEQKRSL